MANLLVHSQLIDIQAKLERANESIQNLDSEIIAFLKPPQCGFSKNKIEAVNQFTAHARRAVPVRFAVLIGEICQHLRSSLDYLVWALSAEDYRRSSESSIAFPICVTKPRTKEEVRNYARKIKGIQSLDALKLVEQLQPYNASIPEADPLAIIHELNRIDKHRALLLVTAFFHAQITLPQPLWTEKALGVWEAEYDVSRLGISNQTQIQFSQYIAVDEIGGLKNEAIISLLTQLLDEIRRVVGLFGGH